VHAATVNRTDCGFLRGMPLIVRPFSGWFKPKFQILGCEFAGEVEAVGKQVTLFKQGDRVFGFNEWVYGSHAEYTTISEHGNVAKIPTTFSYQEAAPLTEGAFYGYFNLRAAKVGKGQNILINGATGAIGSASVQLAKYLGASVTAVCDTKNVPLIQSLGADKVIDYKLQDFTQLNEQFDVVFDAVGKSSFGKCKRLLKNKGIYMSTEFGPNIENPFLALITPLFGGRKVLFPLPSLKPEDVALFKKLADAGQFKPVVDRIYPMSEIREAYQYVLTGQKTGNVVIQVSAEGK